MHINHASMHADEDPGTEQAANKECAKSILPGAILLTNESDPPLPDEGAPVLNLRYNSNTCTVVGIAANQLAVPGFVSLCASAEATSAAPDWKQCSVAPGLLRCGSPHCARSVWQCVNTSGGSGTRSQMRGGACRPGEGRCEMMILSRPAAACCLADDARASQQSVPNLSISCEHICTGTIIGPTMIAGRSCARG